MDAQPTGAGKSVEGVGLHLMLGGRTLYVTGTKGLQEQLGRDFTSIGMADIRGQSNYPCIKLEHRKLKSNGCDKGPCHFGQFCEYHPRYAKEARYIAGCHWFDQLAKVRKAKLVSTNYDFLMAANRYMEPGILGQFDQLVLDEGHEAEGKLAEFCSVKLWEEECIEFFGCSLPPVEDGTDAWVNWALDLRGAVEAIKLAARENAAEDPEWSKRATDLCNRVMFLTTARKWERSEPSEPIVEIPGMESDWVAERGFGVDEGSVTFNPVWAHRYSERFLFTGIPRILIMSATLLKQASKYLGIPEDQLDFIEHTSSYHPDRRPFYVMPTSKIGRNSSEADYRARSIRIDQIIDGRLDRKGIIHTQSYDDAFKIRMESAHKNRIMWHKKDNVQEAVERFRRAPMGTLIISPVLGTGYDFPYSQCEYQIIAKVPFIDNRPQIIKARCRSDKNYLNYLATMKIVQQSGRGMRATDDRCENFILDTNIGWFLQASRKLLPKWFKAAIRYPNAIPNPPPKLTK